MERANTQAKTGAGSDGTTLREMARELAGVHAKVDAAMGELHEVKQLLQRLVGVERQETGRLVRESE